MSYEIKLEKIEKIDEEFVCFDVKIVIDDKFEIEEFVRMCYLKQYDGSYEWESPNCDLGSILGYDENDEYPEFENEDFGEILSEGINEIENWLNENMENKNTN